MSCSTSHVSKVSRRYQPAGRNAPDLENCSGRPAPPSQAAPRCRRWRNDQYLTAVDANAGSREVPFCRWVRCRSLLRATLRTSSWHPKLFKIVQKAVEILLDEDYLVRDKNGRFTSQRRYRLGADKAILRHVPAPTLDVAPRLTAVSGRLLAAPPLPIGDAEDDSCGYAMEHEAEVEARPLSGEVTQPKQCRSEGHDAPGGGHQGAG
jgi:hypothetical protein